MRIFIICSVRDADEYYKSNINEYVIQLENAGHTVHCPHRDTDQKQSGIDICKQNSRAITDADEIHVFYNPESQGTHFDLGAVFIINKRIKVVETVTSGKEIRTVKGVHYGPGKSFPRMIAEWEKSS